MPLDRLQPARRQTLADQVFETLADMLQSGALKPHDKLSLRDLAERLEVSIMPVRDAVGRLAATGALDVSPKRAVTVPLMTVAEFEDLAMVRMLNEGAAARLAAERATRTERARVLAYADRFEEVLDRGLGATAALSANRDLHFALYAAAGSPALMGLIHRLWLKAGPIINYDLGRDTDPQERSHHSRQHHRMLCDALTARDGDAAAEAVAADIRTASELIRAEVGRGNDCGRIAP